MTAKRYKKGDYIWLKDEYKCGNYQVYKVVDPADGDFTITYKWAGFKHLLQVPTENIGMFEAYPFQGEEVKKDEQYIPYWSYHTRRERSRA